MPGYTATWAAEGAWTGPWLASFGFVVIGIDTNSPNDFDTQRGTQLLAALDYLTQRSSVRDRVDASRLAVMGHSMGGGGAMNASLPRLSAPDMWRRWVETNYRAGEEAMAHEATAVVCFNDLSAIGVISRLRDEGMDVPRDISVTGFDDLVIGRHFFPALATASSPRHQLGRRGWALLQDAINGRPPEENAVMPTATLHRTQSTGPVRSR